MHMSLHVAGDVARRKGQRVQLLGGRVGEDEDGLSDGVVERRSTREALHLGLLGGHRWREGEMPLTAKHRSDRSAADRRQEVELSSLQREPSDVARDDDVIDVRDAGYRTQSDDLRVACAVHVGRRLARESGRHPQRKHDQGTFHGGSFASRS